MSDRDGKNSCLIHFENLSGIYPFDLPIVSAIDDTTSMRNTATNTGTREETMKLNSKHLRPFKATGITVKAANEAVAEYAAMGNNLLWDMVKEAREETRACVFAATTGAGRFYLGMAREVALRSVMIGVAIRMSHGAKISDTAQGGFRTPTDADTQQLVDEAVARMTQPA